MAKELYDNAITRATDWGGDASTGGKPVTGRRVQEYIKGEIAALEQAVADVPVTVVDASLDTASTNAIQNGAVARRLGEIESGTVTDIEAEVNDDETAVTLRLLGRGGGVIADCEIPYSAGGGQGSPEATRLILAPVVDASTIKAGDPITLTYDYDLVYMAGEDKDTSTGTKATIEVSVRCGDTEVYSSITNNVAPGRYSINLTDYVIAGVNDVYVTARWTDPNSGEQRSKMKYTSVKVVALQLESAMSLTEVVSKLGYGSEVVQIPYRVQGSGTKSVLLYVDGAQTQTQTVTQTAPTNGSFIVNFGALAAGAHTVQMVATMSEGGHELRSQAIYLRLMKAGTSPGVVMKAVIPDGRIALGGQHLTPTMECRCFDPVDLTYGVYSTSSATATAEVLVDGTVMSTVSAPRTEQSYSGRFSSEGAHSIAVRCGSVTATLGMSVQPGLVSVSEATYGLACKLNALGRSNSESTAARRVWTDRGVTTTFDGVDWASSGWTGRTLRLINGARATVNIQPFASDTGSTGVKAQGRTIEMTLTISNVTDDNTPIVSCMYDGKGFRVMGSEIAFLTGQVIEYKNEDDEDCTRPCKLSSNYVSGRRMKVALVIDKAADRRVMHLYIDGNRCGADIYDANYSFAQGQPQGITFDSSVADIEVESVRVYNRGISDDEELSNDIADTPDTTRMLERYNENDILGQGGSVSRDALRTRGKSVMVIVRPNLLDDVYAENDKKTDFTADVYYYSALGQEYDFVCQGCNIRIQGTSSTKYPSKNIRVYLSKGPNSSKPVLTVGGERATNNKYALRPGAIPMNLYTAKSDYSDSSMSLNTGGAKLFNDIFKELGLLTPPQRKQLEADGAIRYRTAIDGLPIDMFTAASADSEPIYVGQYNFNNEKSKSDDLFGMSMDDPTFTCKITLESLNNMQPLCLFSSPGDVDALLDDTFDKAFEFNYPEDTFWTQAKLAENGKGSIASTAQKTAVRRLVAWIKSCVPAGATTSDITTFVSQKFKDEISQYFDQSFLLTYYLWTEFFVSVDQRAKNIMWRTWDGLKWYPTYYDGDTQRGKRNDSFMVYDPDTERDTWDAQAQKWAFEGHDSWLWCLCLANLQPELAGCALSLREKLTVERTLDMLLTEQSGNWSDRAYNKSGEIKYITPAIVTTYGKTWPFIYGLQGADRQHSEWFIRQRWSLLDAKYGIGSYTSDNIDCYLAREAADPTDVVRITGSRTYAYGYGTNNAPKLGTTGIVPAGQQATLSITEAFTVNDPVRIYGASRMTSLDLSGACAHLKNGFDVSRCALLEEIDVHVPSGKQPSSGWWLAGLQNCKLLRSVNLRGQTDASTTSGSLTLDLSGLTRIESVLASGTRIGAVTIAAGAPVSVLELPQTVTNLTLDHLPRLTMSGLQVASYASVGSMSVQGCPQLDTKTLVQTWLAAIDTQKGGRTLTLDGVSWTLSSPTLMMDMLAKVETISLSGTVTITGDLSAAQVDALREVFGTDMSSANPERGLRVDLQGGTVILARDSAQFPGGVNPVMYAHLMAKTTNMINLPAAVATRGYMTEADAAAVTGFNSSVFTDTTVSQPATFHELKYFTGLEQQNASAIDFYRSHNFIEVSLPAHQQTIKQAIAQECDVQVIVLPPALTNMVYRTFEDAWNLRSVWFSSPTPPTLYSGSLNNSKLPGRDVAASDKIMYVPQGSRSAYESMKASIGLGAYTIVEY